MFINKTYIIYFKLFQFKIRASDNGTPVRSVERRVRIQVTRNQYLPVFQNLPYFQTVSENVYNGSAIFTVTVEDRDVLGEIVYELVGVSPAPEFFGIDSERGNVWVINPLFSDNRVQVFDVSIAL